MVSETSVATAALAIAISALVIAAGQLVAQLFSTADGYRRCQRSVIGDWYKLVELPFRWSSFRYEVKVTTPHFEIATMDECHFQTSFHLSEDKPLPKYPALFRPNKSRYLNSPRNRVALVGDFVSRRGTLCPHSSSEKEGIGEDVPTWFDLLDDVHDVQRRYSRFGMRRSSPWETKDLAPIGISRKTRSWDFMPPDIVRPVASTTVGCLITMAYRLGMIWTDFRLDEGIMRAMGDGKSFSTSIVRGMGLVVEYSTSASDLRDHQRIPYKTADKLTFGIISSLGVPIDPKFSWFSLDLHLRDKKLSEVVNLSRGPHSLSISSEAERALETSLSHQDPAHRLPAFTDVLGLWCRWLPVESISSKVIDNPFPFPLSTMGERPESRNVWKLELERREATLSEPCKQVLRFYRDWEACDVSSFGVACKINQMHPAWTILHTAFEATTRYLQNTEGVSFWWMYKFYITCHVDVNASSLYHAEKNIERGRDKTRHSDSLPDDRDPIFTERAYIYAENVPEFVKEMERREPSDGKFSYEDVWWMMMMRLHAWTMCVEWVDREGVKIPSEYYDNPARVYIL